MNTARHNVNEHPAQVFPSGFSTDLPAKDSQNGRSDKAPNGAAGTPLFIYVQWHVGDYTLGTQGMSLELEGGYQRFLMRLYARGKPLPDDDSIMASIMSLSTRVWRRIKMALVEMGKIIVRSGCLTNERFERERLKRAEELRKRSLAAQARWQAEREKAALSKRVEKTNLATETPVSAKFEPSLPETSGKLSGKSDEKTNEINGLHGKGAYANQYPLTNNNTTLLARVRTREELEAIRKRLAEAGGSAVNEALPGFMVLSEPISWLDNGCDLEMDVVPIVQRAVQSKRNGRISGWAYFRAAVLEARDRRLAPLPAGPSAALNANQPPPTHWRDREAERARNLGKAIDEAVAARRAAACAQAIGAQA